MKIVFKIFLVFLVSFLLDNAVYAEKMPYFLQNLQEDKNAVVNEYKNNSTVTIKNNSNDEIFYFITQNKPKNIVIKIQPKDQKKLNIENIEYSFCSKKQLELSLKDAELTKKQFQNKFKNNILTASPPYRYLDDGYSTTGGNNVCAAVNDQIILNTEGINLDIKSENIKNISYLKHYTQVNHIKNNSDKKLMIITVNSPYKEIVESYKSTDLTLLKSRETMSLFSFFPIAWLVYTPIWVADEIISVPINQTKYLFANYNKKYLPAQVEMMELIPNQDGVIFSNGPIICIYDYKNKVIYNINTNKTKR